MADGLPPPPTRAEAESFAWTSWYQQLYSTITQVGAINWTVVSKAGSSLNDLADRNHVYLTGVLGTGSYHISSTEAGHVAALPDISGNAATATLASTGVLHSKAGDPVVADITAGTYAMYKNTSAGTVRLWVNDGGTLRSVALT